MPKRTGRPPGLTPDGPKIRRLRVEHGLTAVQLGALTGFQAQSIRYAERGGNIGDVFASRIARALGVRMSDITDWTESEPEPKALAS